MRLSIKLKLNTGLFCPYSKIDVPPVVFPSNIEIPCHLNKDKTTIILLTFNKYSFCES